MPDHGESAEMSLGGGQGRGRQEPFGFVALALRGR